MNTYKWDEDFYNEILKDHQFRYGKFDPIPYPIINNQTNEIFDLITEALRDAVANQIIDELLTIAQSGEQTSALKLGKTYTELLVAPNYPSAYVWLSIAQAYGVESASDLLRKVADNLSVEEILAQQEQASNKFAEINS